jgi:hypothetical protein
MKDSLRVDPEHFATLTIDSHRTNALRRVVLGVEVADERDIVGRAKKAARVRAAASATR